MTGQILKYVFILTDHCKAVEDLLRYEAFRRFGFEPDSEDLEKFGEDRPVYKPRYYKDVIWRPQLFFSGMQKFIQ